MSLWLQSLRWCLEDAKSQEERIKCYSKHLEMPIAKELIKRGQIQGIVKDFQREKVCLK